MPDEVQDASAVSSPAPDAPAASSAEQSPETQQPSEQAPPQPSQPATPPFNMPPADRWEQLRRERQEAVDRANRAEAMARMALEKLQTASPGPVQPDPWEGKVNHPDPATAQFWQEQRRLSQVEAERIADQKLQGVLQVVNAGRAELAALKAAQFRKENPEISPGSEVETAIVQLMGQGYDIESAKKLVLYDRVESELKALKSKQATVGQKVAANATGPTTSIPATSGLPGQPGNWRENVKQAIRKGGSLADIVNAAGASRQAQEPSP